MSLAFVNFMPTWSESIIGILTVGSLILLAIIFELLNNRSKRNDTNKIGKR